MPPSQKYPIVAHRACNCLSHTKRALSIFIDQSLRDFAGSLQRRRERDFAVAHLEMAKRAITQDRQVDEADMFSSYSEVNQVRCDHLKLGRSSQTRLRVGEQTERPARPGNPRSFDAILVRMLPAVLHEGCCASGDETISVVLYLARDQIITGILKVSSARPYKQFRIVRECTPLLALATACRYTSLLPCWLR
jgi:hypothetical protein